MKPVNTNALPQTSAQGLSQHILENYRQLSSSVRQDYLDYLTAKTRDYAKSVSVRCESGTSQSHEMKALLERIYFTLEPYAVELNRVNGSEARILELSVQPPCLTNEITDSSSQRRADRTVSYYRCRFSTRLLSLVIRGSEDCIDFFLIPTDRVLGLSLIEAQTKPLMSFTFEHAQGWTVEGKELNHDRLERYSLLTLEHLLDRTQEEQSCYQRR
ncbi:MAG: hypothetical protein SFV17_09765 [Candidatus Obscuribacter sp.]|nr:hypothetical protein [Candidatus Melainabacteria bacterium]MDX1986965.1 hypothetical protein [Candidatus Obscuribacter sp.]